MNRRRRRVALAGSLFSFLIAPDTHAQLLAPTSPAAVTALNPLAIGRVDEVIALPWSKLTSAVTLLRPNLVRVVDDRQREMVSQVVDNDGDGTPDELLFLADFRPKETRSFFIEAVAPSSNPAARVFIRHDEPRDDMAWESDRIAFRIYGEGLKKTAAAMSSNGIDVWTKRVRGLVVEKWYTSGNNSYHRDRGEGADFFDVGETLGAGGTAIWKNDSIYRADNFKAWKILANGPVRAIVQLRYDPWSGGGVTVAELKRISIDAGQNVYRSESVFQSDVGSDIPYAIGLVKRPGMRDTHSSEAEWAWLSGWGPVARRNGGHGELGTAVLLPRSRVKDWRETHNHYLAISRARSGETVVHYVGAGWTASGDFPDPQSWRAYLDNFARRLSSPIEVTLATGVASSAHVAVTPAKAPISRLDSLTAHALEYSKAQLRKSATTLDPSNGFPRATRADGSWNQLRYNQWTSGFFAGTLWYMYHLDRDDEWKALAEKWTAGMEPAKSMRSTHDLGFMIYNSFGHGLSLTGNPHYREVVTEASRNLSSRYSPVVGAIKSWDTERRTDRRKTWKYPVIVDNLMNLELLFRSSAQGEPQWREIAERHALTSARAHVRRDGSTAHVALFDPVTGRFERNDTWQGFSDSSAWARGQAWAIHGLAAAYANTGKKELLRSAISAANYFIAHLPADGIPYWDLLHPDIPNVERDASAAAIAASGLLELSRHTKRAESQRFRRKAERIIGSLSATYLTEGTGSQAILAHSVGNRPQNGEVDVGLVYADYYFVEALLRLKGIYWR